MRLGGRFSEEFRPEELKVEDHLSLIAVVGRGMKAVPGSSGQFLSEFGGWSLKIPDHSFNLEKTYGYKKYEDRERFVRDLRSLYLEQVLPLVREGLCAAVYTQVSDVEDETNGLLTFDRKVSKITPEEFRDVSEQLIRAIASDSGSH